jgi:hypothetical protein
MNPLVLPARNRGIYVGVILVTFCLSITLIAIAPRAGASRLSQCARSGQHVSVAAKDVVLIATAPRSAACPDDGC